MKKKLIVEILFISTIALSSACSINSPLNNISTESPGSYSSRQKQTDEKIIESMIILNKNEIYAAELALQKSSNPKIRNFAALMNKAHTHNLNEIQALSHKLNLTPVLGNTARALKQKGKQEINSLNHLSNKSFDKAYIDAMVKAHQGALQLLDNQFIKMAVNPLLKQQLVNTRSHVNEHLHKAIAVQKSI